MRHATSWGHVRPRQGLGAMATTSRSILTAPTRALDEGAALPMGLLMPGLCHVPLKYTTRGPKSLPTPTRFSDKDYGRPRRIPATAAHRAEWGIPGQPPLLKAETRPGAGSVAGPDSLMAT